MAVVFIKGVNRIVHLPTKSIAQRNKDHSSKGLVMEWGRPRPHRVV